MREILREKRDAGRAATVQGSKGKGKGNAEDFTSG
jgi:hypothetical protein